MKGNRILAIIISVILVIGMLTVPTVFANESDISLYNNFEDVKKGIDISKIGLNDLKKLLFDIELNSRQNDSEFKMHMEAAPEEAIDMINTIVSNQIDELYGYGYNPYTGNSTNAWVSAPLIQQSTSYWCGPCSVVQVAEGYGTNISGTSNQAKQQTIVNYINTTYPSDPVTTNGTYVYQISQCCTKYAGGGYTYKAGANLTDAQFKNTITNSLINNKCPILHARTQYISYYNGHSSGHYICLSAVNNETNKVRLTDCNYNDTYYGTRSIPRSEAYNAVKASGRYLISANMA